MVRPRWANVSLLRIQPMTLLAAGVVACVGAGTAPRILVAEPAASPPAAVAASDPGPLDGYRAARESPRAHPPFADDLPTEDARAHPARCPPGTLSDDGACVKLPSSLEEQSWGEDPVGAPEGEATAGGHYERSGSWVAYEQIPRRPDRPADYDAYLYPIEPGLPGGHSVVSGYDLDLPDSLQRRTHGRGIHGRGGHGRGGMGAVGHGGVDLPQRRGTPIKLLALEHQVGDARVIHVGPLFGLSVVTLHTLREGGRDREYVLIHGHVDAFAEGLRPGETIKAGEVIAFVGDTGSPELVHLHLEARRVRDGVEGVKLLPGRILAPDATIVCDPRNVLPLKP